MTSTRESLIVLFAAVVGVLLLAAGRKLSTGGADPLPGTSRTPRRVPVSRPPGGLSRAILTDSVLYSDGLVDDLRGQS